MRTSTSTVDPALRRRCRALLADHRRRARAQYQAVPYSRADLERLAAAARCCGYCGTPLPPSALTLDHRVPIARGGAFNLENLLPSCFVCNERKGCLTEEEYRQLLALLHRWHPKAGNDVLARLRAGGRRYAAPRRRG